MLNLVCNEYRNQFLPGVPHTHRASCAACDTWAERIELTIMPGPDHELPSRLADRLRRIAQDEDCRWVHETWKDLIDGLMPTEQKHRLERHLAACDRCKETVATLESFIEEAQELLPDSLAMRLRSIPSSDKRRPPIWILQTRYAAAASYLLIVLTYLTIGNPVVAAREKLVPLRNNAATALSTGKASLTNQSKAAYSTSASHWNEYRTEIRNTTRSWADDISESWSRRTSDDDEKKGPSGDKENEAP